MTSGIVGTPLDDSLEGSGVILVGEEITTELTDIIGESNASPAGIKEAAAATKAIGKE